MDFKDMCALFQRLEKMYSALFKKIGEEKGDIGVDLGPHEGFLEHADLKPIPEWKGGCDET